MMTLEILLMEYREDKRPFPTYAELIGLCSVQANNSGQVAPQATVEPQWQELCDAMDGANSESKYTKAAELLKNAVLDNIAAPPISKATADDSKFWPVDMSMSRKQMAEQIGQMNFRLTALRNENEGLIRANLCLKATSKADTGEAIRNAALEEAAKIANSNYICWPIGVESKATSATAMSIEKGILGLRSATPSTIKAVPTGEQL